MKRYLLGLLTAACLVLSGCSWLDGNYHSVTPHVQQNSSTANQVVEAANYLQLRTALENMISSGTESRVISVGEFSQEQLERSMDIAIRYVMDSYPIGAYAVEDITYELGTSGGVPAVAVEITYLHSRTEINRIQRAENMSGAESLIADALSDYDTSLVVLIENYEYADITQMVDDFAAENPSLVMETPEVTEQTFPNSGKERVLELKFTYQSSRDDLRSMQQQVQRIFDSAALYVSSNAADSQKYAQLYAFLMERFPEYQIKTSITPAYSLLNHGVGDSRSFAVVYAEMCREAGMECQIVVGTRNGEPWFWNMILDGGYYYHVDLLACRNSGSFWESTDSQMANYVWDYSAYPVCTGAPPASVEETVPPTEAEQPVETETVPAAEPPTEEEKNLE